ncbi:hypothetical protein [Spirosoma arcticum]
MTLEKPAVPELDFATYQERQVRETTPEQLAYRARQLRQSGKFAYEDGNWHGLSYEGYAVVSMVDTNPSNADLSDRLQNMQHQLVSCFDLPETCFLLPPDSFHQTVANTLSDDRFRENVVANGLEEQYPSLIQTAFDQISTTTEPEPIRMRLVGLSLFSGAIGILGIFDQQADYERILHFREQFYADENLARLTVRRTRPFIGHITLAYLEADLTDDEKHRLVSTCVAVNQSLAEQPLFFTISTTELRKYPHLADFQTKPGYPVYSFV